MTIGSPKTHPRTVNSFVSLSVVTDWKDLQAEAVIFGIPHGKPHLPYQFPNNQSTAPTALRAAIPRTPFNWKSLDVDPQRTACVGDFTIVDDGDIPLKGAMFSCIATLL